MITELEFKSLAAQGYNRIPLLAEAFADLETPLSLYLKLAYGRRRQAQLPARIGRRRRALRPLLLHRPAGAHAAARHRLQHRGRHRRRRRRDARGQPAGLHRRLPEALQGRRCGPGLPRFCGGLAGYFGYDAVRYIEPKLAQTWKAGGIDTPDILLLQTRGTGGHRQPVGPPVPDRLRRPGASPRPTSRPSGAWPSWATSCATASPRRRSSAAPSHAVEREFAKADYLPRCAARKEYIAAGDMMQVQIGQRLKQALHREPAVAVPRAALAEPVALHVLLRHGRLPDRRRLARDPGAPGAHARRRQGDDPPAGRHAPARRHARAGQGARGRTAGRPEGARRAPDADRPGAQRHRPHRQDRQREGDRGLRRSSATRT